jgi:HSP20 family molecular chaperone IbpA
MADPKNWMWVEACALIDRAERLQRQFFRPGLVGAPEASWEPPVDIFETEKELWVMVAIPGIEHQDVDVSIKADVMVVVGLRRLPEVARHAVIHRLEIPHGRFERRIRIPAGRFKLNRSEFVCGCLLLTLTKQL